MKTIIKLTIVILLFFFSVGVKSHASVTGAAEGFIKDAQTGEPISDVKITLVYTKSASVKFNLSSDKKGHFYKGGLTPGMYEITAEKEGYVPVKSSLRIRMADTSQLEVKLNSFEGAAPKSSKLSRQGINLFNAGRYEEAIEILTQAISEDPSNPIFYNYRGTSFEKGGNLDKALEDYQKSAELKPDFILPTVKMGTIYAKKKDFEKAIEFYKKAIQLGDQDVTTYFNYGVCLMNLGNNEEAKVIFEKLISLDENYSDAYYQLGIIHIGLGDAVTAKEYLQSFIEMDSENQNANIAREIIKSLGMP